MKTEIKELPEKWKDEAMTMVEASAAFDYEHHRLVIAKGNVLLDCANELRKLLNEK